MADPTVDVYIDGFKLYYGKLIGQPYVESWPRRMMRHELHCRGLKRVCGANGCPFLSHAIASLRMQHESLAQGATIDATLLGAQW